MSLVVSSICKLLCSPPGTAVLISFSLHKTPQDRPDGPPSQRGTRQPEVESDRPLGGTLALALAWSANDSHGVKSGLAWSGRSLTLAKLGATVPIYVRGNRGYRGPPRDQP